ncbi:MAG: IPT/TIG domain-containing protein [Myxococcales bacterium]|nr:IPT/TIG domain-containing protein [Myxococcales bacterium]
MRRTRLWMVFTLCLSVGISVVTAACGPPAPKNLGEDCKTTQDCNANLICNSGKCVDARLPSDTRKPTANAGNDKSVKVGEEVTLDGAASQSIEGKTLTYKWEIKTKPDGSTASLSAADQASTKLTPDKVGVYVVSLMVNDGKDSDPDEVTINVASSNRAPTANAGQNVRVEVGNKVDLDGSGSTDPDAGDKLTYTWEVFKKPDGSSASLSDSSSEKPSITPDKVGSYGIRLTVSDGALSASATVFIEAVINSPAPELTSLNPAGGATKTKVTVQINGKNFLFGLKLLFDKKEVSDYQFKGPDQLIAQFDLTSTPVGKYKVEITNPDTKTSNALDFDVVDGGTPTITKLSPELLITGQSLRLVVEGTNFLDGAKVVFNNQDLTTFFESDTKISASLTAPAPGEYEVKVINPDAKETPALKVVVSGVQAILNDLSLDRIGNDCQKETITVSGNNFQQGLSAELVDKADPSKTYAATTITVTSLTEVKLDFDFTKIPVGAYDVSIKNPDTPASKPLTFWVTEPPGTPEILSVHPSKFFYGGKVKVYVTGLNLDKSSSVVATGFTGKVSKAFNTVSYELEIDTTAVAMAGKLSFELTASCGRKSAAVEVEAIDEAKPEITRVDLGVFTGTAPTKAVIRGKGFGLAPAVTVNGTAVTPVTRVDSYTLEIPGATFTAAGDYKFIVENKGMQKSDEYTAKFISGNMPDPGMVITGNPSPTSSLFYWSGTGLRSDESPAGDPVILLFDLNGSPVCTTAGISTTDSASYSDAIYGSDNPPDCDTGAPPLPSGAYYVQIMKDDNGTKRYSNLFLFDPGGGSGPTTTETEYPLIRYANPSSFVNVTTTTITTRIYLYNGGSSSDVFDVYLNGQKLDTTVDANFLFARTSSSYFDLTISKPANDTAHNVQVAFAGKPEKSNVLQIHVDSTNKVRMKTNGISSSYEMVYDIDTPAGVDFEMYGDLIGDTGNKVSVGGTVESMSGSSVYYRWFYVSSTDFPTRFPTAGPVTYFVTDSAGTKISNENIYQFISSKNDGWGTYKIPLDLLFLSEGLAAYPGEKVTVRLAGTGFIKEDAQMNKGEILFDGKGITDFTVTAPTTSNFGYAEAKDIDIAGNARVFPVQFSNPDKTKTRNYYFTVQSPGMPIIRNYKFGTSSLNYAYTSAIKPEGKQTITLLGEGFDKTSGTFYFAGRVVNGKVDDLGSATAELDTRDLQPGLYPFWFVTGGKSTNTIWVNVTTGEKPTTTTPKFKIFGPFYLDSKGLTGITSNVRFVVQGDDLSPNIDLVVGTKKSKLMYSGYSTTYFLADIDLTGVTAGTYDVYLEDTNAGYTSPKLRLTIE